MEQFLVSLSTGGLVEGSYSTLDKAKAAVEAHYHLIRGDRPDRSGDMFWWPVASDTLHWCVRYDVVPHYSNMPRNSTPDGILESISITTMDVDAPLPMV